jgi:glutamine synthetase
MTSTKQLLEYVWIDLNGNLRSKIKVNIGFTINKLEKCPIWNFDGSSTGQSLSNTISDVIINPVRLYKNPLLNHPNSLIVLCECLNSDMTPHEMNGRVKCVKTSEKYKEFDCLFGIEQEYVILQRNGIPYKWLNITEPGIGDQGPYYCSVGGDRAFGREISDEHLLCCLEAGINICGTNAEVMPSQWEFQIGTCDMLTVSDDLLVARFLLHKITEKHNCSVSFYPKLFGAWNGSGGHTNFSTKQMRHGGISSRDSYKLRPPEWRPEKMTGMINIVEACEKLSNKHVEHIQVYGLDNDKRLTGKHETSSINTFSWGKQNRNCSVRIPLQVCIDNRGYLEDRRPASNMDPYLVTEIMVTTICS